MVAVTAFQSLLNALCIDVHTEERRTIHRCGERLRQTHATHPTGDNEPAVEASAKMPASGLGERFIGALHDALAADVNPRAGGHLAVHHQALALELVEMLPVGPAADEVGICDQHPRRSLMR